MNKPEWHDGQPISGFWKGEGYLSMGAKPMFSLTWTFLYRLIKLKLLSPRGDKFKLMIADYGYDN